VSEIVGVGMYVADASPIQSVGRGGAEEEDGLGLGKRGSLARRTVTSSSDGETPHARSAVDTCFAGIAPAGPP
jgi:hypothetical protein